MFVCGECFCFCCVLGCVVVWVFYFVCVGFDIGCLVNNLVLNVGEMLSCVLLLFNIFNLKRSGIDIWGFFVLYFEFLKVRFGCFLNFFIVVEKCVL